MIKKNLTVLFIVVFIFLTACSQKEVKLSPKKGLFDISFRWGRENMCQMGFSPSISLKNVPEGTRFLEVKLEDVNMPHINHGTNRLPYTGSRYIRAGALRSYLGPCPQRGHTHRYRFTVLAIDANEKIIGKTEQLRNCSNID